MSTRRSSMDSTPIAANIAARSSGEWTRYGKLGSRALCDFLVRRFVEEVSRELAGQLQLHDPAVTIWVRVDQLRVGCQLVVDSADAPSHRRVKVAGRLDRLDHAEAVSNGQFPTGARQLEKHDVAKLGLSEVGDAHRHDLAFDREPLVRL